jgi:crossover junction endodeoxyribonuclease RuvC
MKSSPTQPDQGSLRVFGIDPGLADVGYGVIDWRAAESKGQLVTMGLVQTRAGLPLAERLYQIFTRLNALIEETRPDVVAIEELFFAKNVKTAMVVAHGRAACVLATASRRVPLCEYTPLQIKQALTGHGRAGKEQVQWMVRALLGLTETPKPDHIADALAAALCHVHSLALTEKIQRATGKMTGNGDGTESPCAADLDPRKMMLAQVRRHRRRR